MISNDSMTAINCGELMLVLRGFSSRVYKRTADMITRCGVKTRTRALCNERRCVLHMGLART